MKLNIVPARQGVQWFKLGVRTFFKQPIALSGLFLMFMVGMWILTAIPLAGHILAMALVPGGTLGLMAATEETTKGKFPTPTVLLSAFRVGRQQAKSMLILGLIYAAGFLLLLGVSATVDGGTFARFYLLGTPLTPEALNETSFQMATLLAMALSMPLTLLFWHAPALVHWHGISPIKSLFFSLVACKRNIWAFTIYSLVWFGTCIGVSLPLALIASNLGSSEDVSGVIFSFGMLVLASMFFTSIYFTFKDCFEDTPEATP
jgi:hypothetical protein